MSRHHQASRRRSYRRRQHELHERFDHQERHPTEAAERRDEAVALDERRPGLVRWPTPAWAGLR